MLEQLVNYYCDGNKAKFAAKLGIKPQALSMWFSRDSFDAELVYTKCESISAEWLLSHGMGEMLKTNNPAIKNSVDESDKKFYQEQIQFLTGQVKDLSQRNHELEDELRNIHRERKADVG